MKTLIHNDLIFSVRLSPARRTIGITVERDGSLSVAAPEYCTDDTMAEFIRSRQEWIYTKLARKQMLYGTQSSKEYVPGEGFYYQGRSYRLLFVDRFDGLTEHDTLPGYALRLYRGRFELLRSEQARGQQHFIDWYMEHGQAWLENMVRYWQTHMRKQPAGIDVRSLGYRWGACTPQERLLFHWRVALLPKRYAEYIIAHELAHLEESHHNQTFWEIIERILPDYRQRKEWLMQNGSRFTL